MIAKSALVEGLLVLVIIALGMYEGVHVAHEVQFTFSDEPVGPGWYIVLLSTAMLITVMCPIYSWFREPRRASKSLEEGAREAKQVSFFNFSGPACMGMLALLVYTAILPILGYWISTTLFFISALRIFGQKSWLKCITISICLGLVFYFGFVVLAEVDMPQSKFF